METLLPPSQVNSLIAYGMTGLRMSGGAIAVNGAASVLLYLIGQQVRLNGSVFGRDASVLSAAPTLPFGDHGWVQTCIHTHARAYV